MVVCQGTDDEGGSKDDSGEAGSVSFSPTGSDFDLLARAHEDSGNREEEAKVVERGLKDFPRDPRLHTRRVMTALRKGLSALSLLALKCTT